MPVKKSKKEERKLIAARVGVPFDYPDLGGLTPEEKYLEFFQGIRLEFDFKNYPDFLFFFRGEDCVIQIKKSTKQVWLSGKMWTTFDHIIFEEDTRTFWFIRQIFIDHFKLFLWPQTHTISKYGQL